MAIVEALTVELGSSIAKAILKVWLKDYSIASDITSDLIDLLKGKTKDVIAQQRAKRQFEAIGEKVAENLLPLFEAENSRFDEGTQVAVALSVTRILNSSKIDPKLLAEEDLDPTKLLIYLQNLHPQRTKDLTSDESEFFERILSEVCQNIVDIASELPSFTEKTLSEILKRENELSRKADVILEEVIRIRRSSERLDSTIQSSLFETEYRRAIVRRLDELELFGADVSKASRRHRLSVAYVTLSIAESKIRDSAIESERQSYITSVDRVVSEHPRILIRGEAGSGKTTLLQWLAVKAASGTFKDYLSKFNDYTPFFVQLRHCVESGLPAPQDFPKLLASSIADLMPKGWVHERLVSGKAFLLIDGLDEVPQLKREDVRQWLQELVASFPNVHYIISTRPPAAGEDWLAPQSFRDSMLQPMSLDDINDFVDHWHAAVEDALHDEVEKAEMEPLASSLKNIIKNNHAIYNLATTPLLCAMISALHRDRRRQLPKDRIELYEACTYMLLERREIERQIDYTDYPKLTYRQKRAFLEDFSYWLIKNGWSSIETSRLDNHFENKLKTMEGLIDLKGKDVRRLFLERSGMLREPVKNYVHFTHKTFQEFLAAHAVIDEDDTGVLVKNAQDDQWREIIVLAAGIASQKTREDIIKGLIQRGDAEQKRRHQFHLLSVACLETSVSLTSKAKDEIEKRLMTLTPPKNLTEAKEWASAGEIAIPYLKKGASGKVATTTACIRALSLIGGDVALSALDAFAHDERITVADELSRAWDSFDKGEFAKRVVSKNSRVQSRPIRSFEDAAYLQYSANVVIIGDSLTSLSPLKKYTQIRSLKIFDAHIVKDYKPLSYLIELESLRLIRCDMLDSLAILEKMQRLGYLNLAYCDKVIDLTPLSKIDRLEALDLSFCSNISDISPLKKLKNLKVVSLAGCDNIKNIEILLTMPQIRHAILPAHATVASSSRHLVFSNKVNNMPDRVSLMMCFYQQIQEVRKKVRSKHVAEYIDDHDALNKSIYDE